MPVKIKHKQLDKIETVAYVNWVSHYNHQLWDVVEMWDIGKIYNVQGDKPIYQSTVDKTDFLDAMKHPTNQNALRFEPLPDIGNTLPIKTPMAYDTKSKINQIIAKYKDNPWYINIISGLIVAAILYFLGFIIGIDYAKIWKWMMGFNNF